MCKSAATALVGTPTVRAAVVSVLAVMNTIGAGYFFGVDRIDGLEICTRRAEIDV
jgi:hypothetical protein